MHGRAIDHYLAGSGTVYPCDHINECGFAASRFPNNGNKLASLHFNIDAIHGREFTRRCLIYLAKIFDLDQCLGFVVWDHAPSLLEVMRMKSASLWTIAF